MQTKINKEIIILLFVSIIASLYFHTFQEVMSERGNADFHLMPAKCLFNGINHYSSYLSYFDEFKSFVPELNLDFLSSHYSFYLANKGCSMSLSQGGEYLQIYYLLLYPLTYFDWPLAKIFWFLFNIFLISTIIYMLCKKYELNNLETIIIIFLILYSVVTRIHLTMGQQAIFVYFFFILPFISKSKYSYLFSGISYAKYSIGYALFLYFIISKKFKIALLSLVPIIFGWLLYSLITKTNPIINIFEPFALMLMNGKISGALNLHLFSFLEDFNLFSGESNRLFAILISIIVNSFFIYKITKLDDELQKLTCLSISVVLFLPHYAHDYIVLLPLVIYTFKNYSNYKNLSRINLILLIYFFYFIGIHQHLGKILPILNFIYLKQFLLLFLLLINIKKKPPKFSFRGF